MTHREKAPAGREAIRAVWKQVLPGARVQVARRQPDGTWLRVLDHPELAKR
jgi:hypothetical protein